MIDNQDIKAKEVMQFETNMNANKMDKIAEFLNHPLISAFLGDLSITCQEEFKLMFEEEFEHIFKSSNLCTISRNSFVQRFVTFINQHRNLGLKLIDVSFEEDYDNESLVCGLHEECVHFPTMCMTASFTYQSNGASMSICILYNVDVSISNAEFSTPDIFAIKNIPFQIDFIF